jgi:hypothetical protein
MFGNAVSDVRGSARHAATRAVAGADASAAMPARIVLGSIVVGSTPPSISALSVFADAAERVGRPRFDDALARFITDPRFSGKF